ncbi:MAG: Procollagen-proline dioxygenase [Herminiimonas sp.]|nr:Procollagen-proline dioxygenase [Herminiimonas sp.]
MNARIHFTPQLKDWIIHNVDRGVPPAALVHRMIEQGFDRLVAEALVHSVWSAMALGTPMPEGAIDTAQIEAAEYRQEPTRLSPENAGSSGGSGVRVASWMTRPVLAVVDNVLSFEECDQLIALATRRLAPSTIVDPDSGFDMASASRSSVGMFFELEETAFISRIDQRVSRLMNLPVENGEGLQVLRYPTGGQSAPHFDFLMPTNAANMASVERSGQRVSTLVIYLNDVLQGGETVFPETGMAVTPRKGCAVYFEYCNSAGQLDSLSLHAALPVQAGEKWVATKWMRERRFISAGSSRKEA